MQSSNHKAGQVARSAREDERVEVFIEQAEGSEARIALRYSTWAEGLGWCSQKTIRIDLEQLDDLHRALTAARHRVKRNRADEGEVSESARVIEFPSLG